MPGSQAAREAFACKPLAAFVADVSAAAVCKLGKQTHIGWCACQEHRVASPVVHRVQPLLNDGVSSMCLFIPAQPSQGLQRHFGAQLALRQSLPTAVCTQSVCMQATPHVFAWMQGCRYGQGNATGVGHLFSLHSCVARVALVLVVHWSQRCWGKVYARVWESRRALL